VMVGAGPARLRATSSPWTRIPRLLRTSGHHGDSPTDRRHQEGAASRHQEGSGVLEGVQRPCPARAMTSSSGRSCAIRKCLSAALEEGSVYQFLLALRHVADAHGGVGVLSGITELNWQSMYRMLSDRGNPTLATLLAVLRALGIDIAFRGSTEPHSTGTRRGMRGVRRDILL
jgi:probable addiction module antidote protein